MSNSRKWGMFIILYLSCFAVGVTQVKVPPVMLTLAEAFDVSLTSIAWLSNIYYVTGVILAIPGAFILNKLGPRKMGITILLFLAIGGFVGAITTNFYIMLFSRVIEGVGFTFSAMVGIVLINQWFEGKSLSLAIGLFSTFSASAAMIMLNFGALWSAAFGWKVLWYISIIISIIMLVFFILFIKTNEELQVQDNNIEEHHSVLDGLKNMRAIILGLCFACSGFVMLAFANLYVTIFESYYGLTIEKASFYSGFIGIIGILASILCGIIISRLKKPELLILVLFIVLSVTCIFTFRLGSDATYLLHVIIVSFCTSMIVPIVFFLAPRTVKSPSQIGSAMSIINLIYFIGALLSAPVVTAVLENHGWSAATIPLVSVSVIGTVICIIYIMVAKKSV